MTTSDYEFITTFNEYYPFERCIISEPEAVNYLFDDILFTEVFIPKTEKIDNISGNYENVLDNTIYVKFKLKDSDKEFRLAYFDFAEGIRETIQYKVMNDELINSWESYYVDYENPDEYSYMKEDLKRQKQLITEKYGECKIKEGFCITNTINIINEL